MVKSIPYDGYTIWLFNIAMEITIWTHPSTAGAVPCCVLPPIFYLKLAEKTPGSPVLWLCLNLAHPKWHFFGGKRWSSVGIRRICTGAPYFFGPKIYQLNVEVADIFHDLFRNQNSFPTLVPKRFGGLMSFDVYIQLSRSQKMIQERFPPNWYFDLDVVIDIDWLSTFEGSRITWGSWGPPTLEQLHTETAVLSIFFGSSSSL